MQLSKNCITLAWSPVLGAYGWSKHKLLILSIIWRHCARWFHKFNRNTINQETLTPKWWSYHPVSGLSFISKLVEWVVALQLNSHGSSNGLESENQSSYKQGHTTEQLTQAGTPAQLLGMIRKQFDENWCTCFSFIEVKTFKTPRSWKVLLWQQLLANRNWKLKNSWSSG